MRKYIIFDTETAGITPENYSLLTACFKVADTSLQVIETLSLKIKPNDNIYRIHPKAMEINKINLSEHDVDAVSYKEARSKLLTFLARHSSMGQEKLTPVGHNVDFDIGFIQHHVLPKEEWEMHIDYHRLDTSVAFDLLKFFNLIPGSAKGNLSNIAKMFGHPNDGAHNAEVDVDMCINVLKSMKQMVRNAIK